MGPDSCSIKVFQSHTFLSVAEFGSFILPFLASIHSFKEFPYGKLYTASNTKETNLKNMLNQYCYSRLSHKSCTYPKLIGATLFRAKLFWFKIVAVSPAAGPEKWLATVQTDIPPPSLSLWWSSWWWCWFWSWWWRWWWGWSWWWGWLWGQGGGQKGKKSLQRKKSFPKKKCTGRTHLLLVTILSLIKRQLALHTSAKEMHTLIKERHTITKERYTFTKERYTITKKRHSPPSSTHPPAST